MGQQDIADTLSELYPDYIPASVISIKAGISDRAVWRGLRAMVKRDELEYLIIQTTHKNSQGPRWIKYYRLKGINLTTIRRQKCKKEIKI